MYMIDVRRVEWRLAGVRIPRWPVVATLLPSPHRLRPHRYDRIPFSIIYTYGWKGIPFTTELYFSPVGKSEEALEEGGGREAARPLVRAAVQRDCHRGQTRQLAYLSLCLSL